VITSSKLLRTRNFKGIAPVGTFRHIGEMLFSHEFLYSFIFLQFADRPRSKRRTDFDTYWFMGCDGVKCDDFSSHSLSSGAFEYHLHSTEIVGSQSLIGIWVFTAWRTCNTHSAVYAIAYMVSVCPSVTSRSSIEAANWRSWFSARYRRFIIQYVVTEGLIGALDSTQVNSTQLEVELIWVESDR